MEPWLLLLHQIPPKPPYFRAKVLRRLSQVGALPIKNSAYLLPDSEETREDFEWICREIRAEGGTAWLFQAESLVGLSGAQIQASFRRLRDADYQELLAVAGELDDAKLTHRFEQLKKIDFFEHPARAQVEAIVADRKQRTEQAGERSLTSDTGRTWVTRHGIKVDRIGSAWLIRRFLDPQATFRFVDPSGYRHAESEIRFDMYEGEFTHEGDFCTFEVLIARHKLQHEHSALEPIAQMIHDIDLKDNRFQRAETLGLARVLEGIYVRCSDDESRLTQGSLIFDSLYQSFLV
jgi:hypothetical protein